MIDKHYEGRLTLEACVCGTCIQVIFSARYSIMFYSKKFKIMTT